MMEHQVNVSQVKRVSLFICSYSVYYFFVNNISSNACF
jgi:hypothetical protein